MKQVIHINYQGRVVPIEQTAFDLLKSYTDSLSIHFDSELGKEEIMHDIKDRIAELFDQRLKKGAACITDEDVNAIINSIGRIEDLKAAEVSDETEPEQKTTNQQTASSKRLYRDENKKIIGGVCAGLANYLNIDVTVVRVIFAVIFLIFGFGLILYLVLWAIVPNSAAGQIGSTRKKLYRDLDHKVVGGVCSGISHYFGVEVWVPRLLFLLPLTTIGLSRIYYDIEWFAGFIPSAIITYLICWIGIPEAKTTSEKLEMKGEKVDMNSIQHVIKEEMKGVKERAKKFSKNAEQQVKAIGAESSSALSRFINAIVRIIIGIIKAISYTILTIIGLAMVLFLLGLSFSSVVIFPFKDFMLNGEWQNYFALGTILFFIILPILAIVVSLIRKIAGIKTKNKWLNISFISLWIVGWISLFGLFSTLGKDFSSVNHRDNNERIIPIQQPTNGRLIIKLKKHPIFDDQENNIGFFEAMELFKDSITINNVRVKIVRSLSDSFEVRTVYSAHGSTRFAADTTASTIQFHINQQDSLLFIDRATNISKNQKFRNQQVVVLIGVPEGKTIDMQDCGSVSNYNNNVWEFDNWQMESDARKLFIMTNDGLQPVGRNENQKTGQQDEEKKEVDSLLKLKNDVEKALQDKLKQGNRRLDSIQ
jgi:phage shock protein PspC (stress-responsive transcriptional regulator)